MQHAIDKLGLRIGHILLNLGYDGGSHLLSTALTLTAGTPLPELPRSTCNSATSPPSVDVATGDSSLDK